MSPLPAQMQSHWWQRPGRTPGRELYHWHILFHDQPAVRELAAAAQGRLAALPGLDMVPSRWLHATTYVVAFVDEVPEDQVTAMVDEARRLLVDAAPIPVALGRVLYHPQAVTLAIEPFGALDPVLDAVRAAASSAGFEGQPGTNPWVPHVSVAYSNTSGPYEPIVAALGRRLPRVDVQVRSVSLVAQTQVERTWRWRPVAEVHLGGRPLSLIYHVATRREWEQARAAGEYRVSTLGRTLEEEGFIHASRASQVAAVANRFYRGAPDLVLLVIDEQRIVADVRHERVPGSDEAFPHIYGPLNTDAVVGATAFVPDADGNYASIRS